VGSKRGAIGITYLVTPVYKTALYPIILDFPTSFPSLSESIIPSFISFDLIIRQFAKLAVPTAAKLIKKLKKSCLGPLKWVEKGVSIFLTPSPTPIDVVTAAV